MSFDTWLAGRTPPKAPMSVNAKRARHYRHMIVWVTQSWLAMFYLASGYAKITEPHEMLTLLMTWPGEFDLAVVRAIGWTEAGLAIGLVAPLLSWPAFRIPLLMSAAALMLNASIMAGYHAVQKDLVLTLVNGFLVALAITVFRGRSARREVRVPS